MTSTKRPAPMARRPHTGHLGLHRRVAPLALAALMIVAACDGSTGEARRGAGTLPTGANGAAREEQPATAAATVQRAPVIDSIFPMPELIRRFQAQFRDSIDSIKAPWFSSRDALLSALEQAIRDNDPARLRALRMTEAEWGFLYFPQSHFARPPFAQPPQTLWQLTDHGSVKGEGRLLRLLGGRRVDISGITCSDSVMSTRTRTWSNCAVAVRVDEEKPARLRLFGSVAERDGRIKLVSLTNDL